jgi:hypothetical protein
LHVCSGRGLLVLARAYRHRGGTTASAGAPGGGLDETRFTLGRTGDGPDAAWSTEVEAHLRRRALAGNALFLLYDLEDAGAIERREGPRCGRAPSPPATGSPPSWSSPPTTASGPSTPIGCASPS